MIVYAFLMPASAVLSFHYFATSYDYFFNGGNDLFSWNIFSELFIAAASAAAFYISLQRSLGLRKIWLSYFKRR